MIKISKIASLIPAIVLLLSTVAHSQEKLQFDPVKFSESEWGKQHRYIKWYSTGKNPAKHFYAFRYEMEKPIAVKGIQMSYLKHDTAFYVLQDTTHVAANENEMLQYFITPHDTSGKVGKSSEIALVAPLGRRWFTKTNADQLEKEKGVMLKWEFTDNSLIKYFEIHRSADYYKDYELIASVSKNDFEFKDTKIKPDIVYYYQLKAVPVDGNKPIGSNVIFAAGFNPNKPMPPYIKHIEAVKNGALLHIQVSDIEAGGVRVYRDNGLSPELFAISDLIKIPDSMIVAYYDTNSGVDGRHTYTYAVKTESTSYIESDFSEKVYVRPLLAKSPDAPVEISVYEEDGIARLFWENMQAKDNAIAGYIIKRKDDSKGSSFENLQGDKVPYPLNYYNDTTVIAGKVYSYLINSVDVDGNVSVAGSIVGLTMHSDKPGTPFALKGYRTNEGLVLEWAQTIYPGIKSMNLYRYQRGVKPSLLTTLPADSTEFTDTNAPEGKPWYYYITTTNVKGEESGRSAEVAVE